MGESREKSGKCQLDFAVIKGEKASARCIHEFGWIIAGCLKEVEKGVAMEQERPSRSVRDGLAFRPAIL